MSDERVNRRRAIPLSVKLEVALAAMGLTLADVDFDHTPPLQLREWDPVAGDTIPPANDPAHIQLLTKAEHKRKTFGGPATVADGDLHRIAKTRRLTEREREFRRKLLIKDTAFLPADHVDQALAAGRGKAPKRKIPSRPFPKRPPA